MNQVLILPGDVKTINSGVKAKDVKNKLTICGILSAFSKRVDFITNMENGTSFFILNLKEGWEATDFNGNTIICDKNNKVRIIYDRDSIYFLK